MSSSGGSNEGRGGTEREGSDLFNVPRPDSMIPRITKIPETPEERRRRTIIRVVSAAIAAVLVIIAVVVALDWRHAAAVEDAVLRAGDTGRTAALKEALGLLEGDDEAEELALRARLRATGALEHGRSKDAERARKLLENEQARSLLEGHVAKAYLALRKGAPKEAHDQVARIAPAGTYAAEAAHATARAMLAVGELERARASASVAVKQRTGAPRYVALLARITERAQGRDSALQVLGKTDASESPIVRIAKARIVFEPRSKDSAGALEQAKAVLQDERATPPEKAWAHLIGARDAAENGQGAKAIDKADKALDTRPPGNESFTLALTETYLRIGDLKRAAKEFDRLPKGVSTNWGRRSQVGAWLALEQGELKRAEKHLAKASKEPWTTLLRARHHQRRNEHEAAARLYRQAAEDSKLLVEAYTRLGGMKLARGDSAQALKLMRKVLARAAHHPEAVPVAVRAHVDQGEPDAAMKLAEDALKAHPGDARLLEARAHVEMSQENWKAALQTLRKACKAQPSNADLHANRGEAARQLDKTDEARKAYGTALEHDADHPTALMGMLDLGVAAEDTERARKTLERIDEAELVNNRIDRARARYYVLAGKGKQGVKDVRRAIIRRSKKDPELWMSLGRLQLQAEEYGAATGAFGRVLRYDEENPWALVGRALAQARLRRTRGAERSLQDARDAKEDRDMTDAREDRFDARVHLVRGWLRYKDERWGGARSHAKRALRLDPEEGRAHVLLASVASERDRDPKPHLRKALKARTPPPEAKAMLALELGETEEGCEFAKAYHEAAPGGRRARSIRRMRFRCRKKFG